MMDPIVTRTVEGKPSHATADSGFQNPGSNIAAGRMLNMSKAILGNKDCPHIVLSLSISIARYSLSW